MNNEQMLMYEAATLYYEKKLTQQEIAGQMKLSRQTVSRLLNDAVRERIVEIRIHDPESTRGSLEAELCGRFGICRCVLCGAGSKDEGIRRAMTVKAAAEYLLPAVQKGGLKIAVSWGRTVRELIHALPETPTSGNTVYPLFGATDNAQSYFSPNELARKLADKLGAELKRAWFPYKPEDPRDYGLLKQLSYYQKLQDLWDTADLAILGIGNTEILDIFRNTFGGSRLRAQIVGDIATHFFDRDGTFMDLYENTLCASVANLKHARETVAIASGNGKAAAIAGALRTGTVDTLITDEHTARRVLEL